MNDSLALSVVDAVRLSPLAARLPLPIPLPSGNLKIRPGVLTDVPFLDSLQKLHTKQVGWMPRAQFEGKIALGHVLIAEERGTGDRGLGTGKENKGQAFSPVPSPASPVPTLVGYCIGNDQYFKHDDIGIIYQMNVLPGRQRGLIGAALLKAQFERSAYGCRLYCCWCAQDIAANRFWEAMGFVPLAFRTGGEKKGPNGTARRHIFWQKRIRQGDTTTPWWFPSQTSGGSMRSDRIVLPIPPGTHWSDAKPMILPGMPMTMANDAPALPSTESVDPPPIAAPSTPRTRKPKPPQAEPVSAIPFDSLKTRGLRFGPVATPVSVATPPPDAAPAASVSAAAPRPARKSTKNDPRLIVAARELRDRWLEQLNTTPLIGCEKYAVSRAVNDAMRIDAIALPALPAPVAA